MGAFATDAVYVALDTSGSEGSVAIGRGSRVLATKRVSESLAQASRLIPAIDRALGTAGLDRSRIDGIVVGEGPGSFTGVRVAAATAKGLSYALGRPLWAVSSLAATALAHDVGPIRYALFDARKDRVYGACYAVGQQSVETLTPVHAGTLRDALGSGVPAEAVFIGDAARRHRMAIEGAGFAVVTDDGTTVAEGLLRYLGRCPESLPIAEPARWEPEYVRPVNAEPLWQA
jgi:tRNA threonylcarbamoyladenosine biosynthesis protein TsaB